MEQLIKYVLGEMRVVRGAPLALSTALLVLSGAIWWAVNWRYAGVIENKDGIIALYKERLNGAGPDEARARIETLQAQVLALRNRQWPPLTVSSATVFKSALNGSGPSQVDVFAQARDGIFLVRSLITALIEIGWEAMNGLPDGLTVWPETDLARRVHDALSSATGLPVTLRDDPYLKQGNRIAIGVGFKVD
jgi:hypothetical protein